MSDTRVSWDYDEATATVTTDFQVDTDVKEGTETRPLLALYRHQWLHTDADFLGYSLRLPARGDEGHRAPPASARTMAYPGIMPMLPAAVEDNPGYDSVLMNAYLDDFLNQSYPQLFYRGDTYYGGKDLGIVSSAIRVADLVGRTDVRDYLLTGLKQKLEDWLSTSAGETQTLFYYNSTWGTMYGFPATFGTGRRAERSPFPLGLFRHGRVGRRHVRSRVGPGRELGRDGQPAHPRCRRLGPGRRHVPLPAVLRPLCRPLLGVGARRVRGRQQPGVLFRVDAVRRRHGAVGLRRPGTTPSATWASISTPPR